MKRKNIFKEGDKIYHHLHGWGFIGEYSQSLPDGVYFVDFHRGVCVSRVVLREEELSFTEYSLVGVSHSRPIDYSAMFGIQGLFWSNENSYCISKLVGYDGNASHPFVMEGNAAFKNFKPLSSRFKRVLKYLTKSHKNENKN